MNYVLEIALKSIENDLVVAFDCLNRSWNRQKLWDDFTLLVNEFGILKSVLESKSNDDIDFNDIYISALIENINKYVNSIAKYDEINSLIFKISKKIAQTITNYENYQKTIKLM